MTRTIDLTGQVFGRLTVVERTKRNGRLAWLCRCVCGVAKTVAGHYLRNGRTRSCGCFRSDFAAANHLSHGGRLHHRGPGARHNAEYGAWLAMKARCARVRLRDYPNYGGRGITVCERWRHDFAAFLADMGPRPTPDHSVDRRDNDGNYEPGNCRWATRVEQGRNKRSNRILTVSGEARTATEWAQRFGVDVRTILRRISLGWHDDAAVRTPVGPSSQAA